MVWVSNCKDNSICVSISAVSRGTNAKVSLQPKSDETECTTKNFWPRSGPETMIIHEEGKDKTYMIGPSDFVEVYPDAVVISRANVHLLGSQVQIWDKLLRLCRCGNPANTIS
jgi:hypothetical protein